MIIHDYISTQDTNPVSSNNHESMSSTNSSTSDNVKNNQETSDVDKKNSHISETTTDGDNSTHSITSAKEGKESIEQEKYTPNLVAVFNGVKDYGYVNASEKDNFVYQFKIDDEVILFKIDCSNGNYKVQNKLKVGYTYDIFLDSNYSKDEIPVITDVCELDTFQIGNDVSYAPSVEALPSDDLLIAGNPGEKTLKNFLTTAMMPVGQTLYIYGGGWNWQDDGASNQARHIGMPIYWNTFFNDNDEYFNYKNPDAANSYYPFGEFNEYYYAGADCSGYVGWALYNTLEKESGNEGYVDYASDIAWNMANNGYGSLTQSFSKSDLKPGCIMSMSGHIWICLGSCDDGSIVIMHSTPSPSKAGIKGGGVQLSALGAMDSEAYSLCNKYMTNYFPEWSERYNVISLDYSTYTEVSTSKTGLFSWNITNNTDYYGLCDPDGYSNMSADDILADIFKDAGK